ncbi:LuxR C-terminal-related transcriptional regulator [Solwaraspora sp. WMMD406]|uniref:helix-turn-helix transcriptional regulator n=1 Tax=Solwaraspora sp. WMMD406 TaxID=3016095 RepID=UPI002416B7BF|nr:LuxR family transcriptional regulator [Solwaraspora sp. WMMD406]MDG4765608.1 LuxR C-terminal-related transcriptional regulator [Solwaraspora sp. WMMD406]
MAYIEYHEALEALRAGLARASAGRGGTVLVVGGLGSGKSALLHEFSQCAAIDGARVVRASGASPERSLPLGVVDQLVQSAQLGEPADQLLRLIGGCDTGHDHPKGHDVGSDCRCARTSSELAKLLLRPGPGRSTKDGPVVVCVDDAEFTDPWSMRVLVAVDRRLRNAHAMLVLTVRSPTQFAIPFLASEMSRPHRERIGLAPMSVESVENLFAKAFDADVAARIALPCHRLSAGNPLLVNALLRDHQERALPARPGAGHPRVPPDESRATAHPDPDPYQPMVAGPHYRQAVVESAHRWERQLLDCVRALAVLDEQCPPPTLGRLLGLGTVTAASLLRTATTAGLVMNDRLRHPAAIEAILADMTAQERAELHRRVAESMFHRGAPAVDVAHHLLAADGKGTHWVARVLREAAEHALAAEDPMHAVRCLELALACAGGAEDRLAVASVLVRALEQVNPSATAAHLEPLWAAAHQGEFRDRDLLTMARLALWQGAHDRVGQVLRAATETNRLLETKTEAELRITYQWFHGSRQDWPARTPDESHDPWPDLARSLTRVWHGSAASAVVGARQLLQSYRLGEVAIEVVATALLALAHGGEPDQATLRCDRLIGQAERRAAITWEALLRVVRAEIALVRGEPAISVAQVDAALHRLPAPRWGVLIAYPLATLVMAHTALGSHETAARVLAQRIPEAADDTVWGLRYRYARGRLKLATGAVLAAANDFHTCGRLMRRWGVDGPVLATWRLDLAEAQFRLGRSDIARDLIQQQLARSGGDSRIRGLALRVLATGSEPWQRIALLRESIDRLRAAGDRLGLIAALTDLAQAHEQLGDGEQARTTARQADHERRAAAGASSDQERRASSDQERRASSDQERRASSDQERRAGRGLTGDHGAEPAGTRMDVGGPTPAADTVVGARPAAEDASADPSPAPLLSVLSDSERRVAELARFGYPNREIACRLFITVSTVEQHLTRIYRKLKVKRKADLRALLTSTSALSQPTDN